MLLSFLFAGRAEMILIWLFRKVKMVNKVLFEKVRPIAIYLSSACECLISFTINRWLSRKISSASLGVMSCFW